MLDSDFAPGLRNLCGWSKVIQASTKSKLSKLSLVSLRVRYYLTYTVAGNSAAVVLEHFVGALTFVKPVEKWSMDS